MEAAASSEGYDFYPQQTIQPFALVDSLSRLNLAASTGLQVTTLDSMPDDEKFDLIVARTT